MTQMVINIHIDNLHIPNNIKILNFKVFKSSTVWIVMNNYSSFIAVTVYTTVTAMRKIRKAITELLRQLGGKRFRKFLFKRVAAAHADHKEVDAIFESLVLTCEEFCENK